MRRSLLAASAALVAVTALTGCSGLPSATTATANPEPGSTGPAPSSSLEPASDADPQSVFPTTCSDLLPLPELQSAIAAHIDVKLDETSISSTLEQVAERQGGALVCRWGGTHRTDGGFDDGATIVATADDAAGYAAATSNSTVSAPIAGVHSALGSCWSQSPGGGCSIDVLQGTTWLHFDFSDSERAYHNTAAVQAATVPLLARVLERLAAAQPLRAPWAAPADTKTAADLCTDDLRSNLASGLHLTLGPQTTPDFGDLPASAIAAGFAGCSWPISGQQYENVTVTVLPGGGWAGTATVPYGPNYYTAFAAQTTPGGATWVLSYADGFIARAVVGGSLVEVESDNYSDGAKKRFISTIGTVLDQLNE